MPSMRRQGLGKGLDALIPQTEESTGLRRVSIDAIVANPMQPRTVFDPEALQELADSIRELGLIQPLIVQRVQETLDAAQPPRYQLITGERRWRAARLAGLRHVDVVVKDASPQEMLELALVENIQRADLNPLEEAHAYAQLVEDFGMTQEQVAARVGRSRVSVTNTMRLLRLPEDVRGMILSGTLSEGHARALLMLDQDDDQSGVARRSSARASLCDRLRSWCGAGRGLFRRLRRRRCAVSARQRLRRWSRTFVRPWGRGSSCFALARADVS